MILIMKILIVSDSHRDNDALRYAIGQEQPFDLLIHAGDVEGDLDTILPPRYRDYRVVCVRGNCDWGSLCPDSELIPVAGDTWHRSIYVTHGHRYNVRYEDDLLLDAARQQLADIVVYGHTHVPACYETADGLLVINPGSVSEPRQASRQPSYAVLTIDDDGLPTAEIRYLPDHLHW